MLGDRWGVRDAEVARRYPCDEIIPAPAVLAWRGVTVAAPPADVWPWVAQLQLAPYSYDWLDNRGRRSPRELRGVPDPRVDEHFMTGATGPTGTVLSVTPGRQLTGRILGAVMSYVVEPEGTSTRLLLKIVLDRYRAFALPIVLGDLVMARRQLLNLKALAERR